MEHVIPRHAYQQRGSVFCLVRAEVILENRNMVVVKLTTAHVTKLPLYLKTRKIGMIYFAKPALTEDLYIVQKEEFSIIRTLGKSPSMFITDKPILSSERTLHKDYNRKGSVEKFLWS
jgi:hypothetical protein